MKRLARRLHYFIIDDNSLELGLYTLPIVVLCAKGITESITESKATKECRLLARSIRREPLQERAGLIPDNARHAHDAAAKIHEILRGTLFRSLKSGGRLLGSEDIVFFFTDFESDAVVNYLSRAYTL